MTHSHWYNIHGRSLEGSHYRSESVIGSSLANSLSVCYNINLAGKDRSDAYSGSYTNPYENSYADAYTQAL